MERKRIAIVGTVGIPANYGGFETLAQNLVLCLSDRFDFTVYCSAYAYKDKPSRWQGATLKYINFKANGIQSIPYDISSIKSAAKSADFILLLGVSGALVLPFLSVSIQNKIIVNVDGVEWKRDKWNIFIKFLLRYSEKLAVNNSKTVIADNEEIKMYLEERYNRRCKLIEYGADHIVADSDVEKGEFAFSVCRIEPENNIHIILEAFSTLGISLKIVGNWQHSDYGRNLYNKYSKCNNIELLAPIYDQNKLDKLRSSCKIYIHGHSAGGTNPSLVEAMYLGLPVVAYDVSYNRITTENAAIFFKDIQSLIHIVQNANDSELNDIAKNLRSIAQKRYTWRTIAEKYADLFN